MSLTGLKFFGCTVKGLQTSLGFGTNKSTVRVDLVEDSKLGDVFTPIEVGFPAYVSLGSFSFAGLVQTYVRNDSESGYHTYQVILEDPRELLEGAKVILSDYLGGTAGVPNLYNVFGYYEQAGFGSSEINEAGMPWDKILVALQTLTNTVSDYGSPLIYRGIQYGLDLSLIPVPSSDYRFGGNDTNILQMISEVCSDVGCDFFVEIIYGTNVIRPRVINRRLPYANELLANYINAKLVSGECVASSIGKESRNENCSTFLIGGQQTYNYQVRESLSYFGQDKNGQPIIGTRTDVNDPWTLTASLNALEVKDIIGTDTYICDLLEMSAAAHSKASWLTYVSNNKPTLAFIIKADNEVGPALAPFNAPQANLNAAWFNLRGDNAVAMADSIQAQTYVWKRERMYQFVLKHHDQYVGKKYLVPVENIKRKIDSETLNVSYSDNVTNVGYSTRPPLGLSPSLASLFGPDNNLYEAFCRYDASCVFETTPAGKTWEFNIPDTAEIQISVDTILNTTFQYLDYELSENPLADDSAFVLYIDSAKGNTIAVAQGIDVDSNVVQTGFTDENGIDSTYSIYFRVTKNIGTGKYSIRITSIKVEELSPFFFDSESAASFRLAEVNTVTNLVGLFDLSRVPTENYVLDTATFGVYIKTNIEDKFYYISNEPYVLVDIPNPPHLTPLTGWGPDVDIALRPFGLNDGFADALDRVNRNWAAGTMSNKIRYLPVAPVSFSIPLQSNVYSYGPWYAAGAYGKVTYQKDNSLTPWNCGGYANMNEIANARVMSSISFQQESESGYFTLVGEPIFNMGDAIVGGPTITNLEIGYSDRGVTTNYRCNTFTNRFGLPSKTNVDRLIRMSRGGEELRKEIRRVSNDVIQRASVVRNAGTQFVQQQLVNSLAPGEKAQTSSVVITFYSDDSNVAGERFVQGGIVPINEAAISWRANDDTLFQHTASMSLEGLVRPISTKLAASESETDEFPSYVQPNTNYTRALTVNDLDPFTDGNDINILIKGDDPDSLDGNNLLTGSLGQNTQRPVVLRGPIVISGWGYSVDGAWVPNSSPADLSGTMLSGYQRKSQKWPTGPMELLWDGERGVWTGLGHCLGVTNSTVTKNGGSSTIVLYQANGEPLSGRKKSRTVYNFFSKDIPSGTRVISVWVPEAARWYVVAADCPN